MPRRTDVVVFPFDAFGSAGTGAGAQRLGDFVQELIEDESETRATPVLKHTTLEELEFNTTNRLTNWYATAVELLKPRLQHQHLFWLCGNHLGVLPVLDQLPRGTLVVQFDAHLDIQQFSDNLTELNHGNFLLHRRQRQHQLINLGHRDLFHPAEAIEQHYEWAVPSEELIRDSAGILKRLQGLSQKAKHIWIDLDVDAIDPAFAPAVQHPLPFGLLPQQLLSLIRAVWSSKVLGVSISEFDPGRDDDERTLQLLGWLLEWLLVQGGELAGKSGDSTRR